MNRDDIRGTDWSYQEIDRVVADYFTMLASELTGQPYVKSHHNEALQREIGRSRGSIEFKYQNISAVLLRLGEPWIPGYKPMVNFQKALIDGIDRHISGREFEAIRGKAPLAKVEKAADLWLGPPPTQGLVETEKEGEYLHRLIRKFDPAARDARNRSLGRQGEEAVLAFEHSRLRSGGREDLARRVRWTAQEDGDGAGYDIHSFDLNGGDRLIEVKTTMGYARTPFFISENERSFSEERKDAFRLIRVYDFARKPAAFEIEPPLTDWIRLDPTVYRATL